MSWFAGKYNKRILKSSTKNQLLPCEFDFHYKTDRLHIWSDKKNTFISQTNKELQILCGNVLEEIDGKWKLADKSWIPENKREYRRGHFVGMRYSEAGIEFYNDQFGLRELYYFQDKDETLYFSTRMDILLKWRTENEIDWEEFGSYWLNRDPLGHGYFIKGIRRLNQAGRLIIHDNKLEKTNKYWTAGREEKYQQEYVNKVIYEIDRLIRAPQNSGYQTVLALSGGYDSRALLVMMIQAGIDFEAITWGRADHPDVEIVREITTGTGIKHGNIYTDLVEDENSWQLFAEYCGRCQLVVMGTAAFELHHYNEIDQEKVLLDGGTGEFIRRCVNANLEYRGKQAIKKRDVKKILSLMHRERADIFQEEQVQMMRRGLNERAELAISEMPDAIDIGFGNWIETWNLRHRVGNISSRSQQILDDIIRNYMPYIQKQVIESAMSIPGRIRARNHILDVMIRQNASQLRKIPTVRNGLKMPYGTGRIDGKIRAILGKRWSYQDNTNRRFLHLHQGRIRDLASDCLHKQHDIYDHKKIDLLVNNYYKNGEQEQELIWWLSFEAFRKQFNIFK